MEPVKGRERQRRRTRKAIIDAAVRLLATDPEPSASAIAEEADVSRRTLYMYFPTVEHLLADAALEATRGRIEPSFDTHGSAEERLEALVRVMQQGFADTEQLGRTIVRLTVGRPAEAVDGIRPRRGYRRVQWIEMALEPMRDRVSPEVFERLVSALTLLMGWESMIVLQDTRGLTAKEAEDVCVWAAETLLAASDPA